MVQWAPGPGSPTSPAPPGSAPPAWGGREGARRGIMTCPLREAGLAEGAEDLGRGRGRGVYLGLASSAVQLRQVRRVCVGRVGLY